MFQEQMLFVCRVLSREDRNFQALYHAFLIMIITGIAYSLLKDTVEAGMLVSLSLLN